MVYGLWAPQCPGMPCAVTLRHCPLHPRTPAIKERRGQQPPEERNAGETTRAHTQTETQGPPHHTQNTHTRTYHTDTLPAPRHTHTDRHHTQQVWSRGRKSESWCTEISKPLTSACTEQPGQFPSRLCCIWTNLKLAASELAFYSHSIKIVMIIY